MTRFPLLSCLTLALLACALAPRSARAQAPLFFANEETTVRGINFKFVDTGTFTESQIKEGALLATQEPTFFDTYFGWIPFRKDPVYPLVPIELQKDVARIRGFYRLNGFLKADIDYPASQLDTSSNTIRVIFTVDEGPPLLIDSVGYHTPEGTPVVERFEGRNQARWRRLRDDSPVRVGERFTSTNFALAKGSILDWIRNRGYAFVTLDADSLVDADANRIALDFSIDPGPFTVVDTILIEGNQSVPDYVVRRELPLQVGQRFSQQKMIEGQRELFGLDLFRVAVAEVPKQERDGTVTVRYTVREAKLRVVRAQTGYGFEDGIVLEPSWTHRNFFGGARQFTVSGEYRSGLGARSSSSYQPITRLGVTASLRQPYVFNRKLSAIVSPFYIREENPNIQSYYQEGGASATLLYELYPFRTVSAQYTFGRAFPLTGSGTGQIEQSVYNRSVINLSATLGKVDDFLNPKRGTLLRPSVEESGTLLPSGMQYYKGSLELVRYQPITDHINVAARIFTGRIWPYGGSEDQADPGVEYRFDRVRFQAGGASDVRGWSLGQLGPQLLRADSIYTPVGGTVGGSPEKLTVSGFEYEGLGGLTKIAGNVEVRLPFPGLGPAWGTAIFSDFGLIDEGAEAVTDAQRRYVTQGGLRVGAGAGVRYETPIGYIRFDLGFKVNPSDSDLYSPGGYYCLVNDIATGDACEAATADLDGSGGEKGGPSFWRRLEPHISIGQAF